MRDPRGRLVSALGLAVVVTSYWWLRLVRPGRHVVFANSDLLVYYYPLYDAAYAWLARGVVPLWNPYQLCGIPWLATLQGGFFYPGHVLFLLLQTHLAMAASSLLHFLLIAFSMTALARRVGFVAASAVLAALLPVVRGALPQLVLVPNYLEAAAWLPLGAIAIHRLAGGEGVRTVLLLALATATSWLAGCPQVTVYLLYAWATLLLAFLVALRAPPARWLGAGVGAVAAVGLGTLVAAVQLVPSYELAGAATRRADPQSLLAMLPAGDERALLPHLIGGTSASLGVVAVSLAAAAIVARRHRALAVWAAVGCLLAVGFSMGTLTPLFRLYLALPVVSWFRVPSRILFLSDFCFALLVAVGVDAMARAPARGRARRLPTAIASGAAGVLAVVMLSRGAHELGALAAAGALTLVAFRRDRSWALSVVVALVVLEAFVAPARGLRLPYDAASAAVYREHEHALRTLADRAGSDRVWIHSDGGPTPDLAPRLATRYGLRSVADYETLNLQRQADYFRFFVEGKYTGGSPFYGWPAGLAPRVGGTGAATRRRLLDMAAVRYVVFRRTAVDEPQVMAFLRDSGLVPRAFSDPALLLFENPGVLPRAFTVHQVSPAPPREQLLGLLADPAFDPLVESFAEVDPGLERASSPPPRGAPAVIVRDELDVVEVEATLAAPGLVVLADSFYSGWHATVDGRAAAIVAVNCLFRGVPAAAGTHRVRFEYRPASLRYGLAISLVGLLLMSGTWLAARRG